VKNPLGRSLVATLICFGWLFTSVALAVDEVKSKKYSHCFREAIKQKVEGGKLDAFMKVCMSTSPEVSVGVQAVEEASFPPSGLRGGGFSCGGAKVEFKFLHSSIQKGGIESVMTISRDERFTILRYDMNIDFIGGVCVPNAQKNPTIVFQAYCGGSGCDDLDNWGIIDPSDLRVLLVPNAWNRKDASRIFGGDLPSIEMISIANEVKKFKH